MLWHSFRSRIWLLRGQSPLAAPHLTWRSYDGYPIEHIGESFTNGQACAALIGEDASLLACNFYLNLFRIAPSLLYRDHYHAAPEFYAPLTGPHGWRFGPHTPLTVRPAHAPTWNDPHRPHLTEVGPTPFLPLFGRTADVVQSAAVIPAIGWPQMKALRL